jgi:hypothetical protein
LARVGTLSTWHDSHEPVLQNWPISGASEAKAKTPVVKANKAVSAIVLIGLRMFSISQKFSEA